MADWYYGDSNRNRQGPISSEDMARLAAQGVIGASTPVWREGFEGWKRWDEVQHEIVTTPMATAMPPAPPAPLRSESASPYAPPRASVHQDAAVQGGHIVYAGFWKRVAASLIDSMVCGVLSWMVQIPIMFALGATGGFEGGGDPFSGSFGIAMALSYLFAILIPLLYVSWMHSSSNQATLGKLAVGIKVCLEDGSRISFWRAFGRYFAYILATMLLLIGVIMVAFTERKQGLHDFLCNTLVVDKYAFTHTPERQNEQLGAVTWIVLILWGLMFFAAIAFVAVLAAAFGAR